MSPPCLIASSAWETERVVGGHFLLLFLGETFLLPIEVASATPHSTHTTFKVWQASVNVRIRVRVALLWHQKRNDRRVVTIDMQKLRDEMTMM